MKIPEGLEPLVDYGIIQEVIRPLMSGKEAQVYVVRAGGEECAAKVYKEASQRTFKHRVAYTEGRRTRNSRDQRAMNKRTRHGRKQDESAWRNAEVDTIYRLRDAGVRVPEPINFVDGVLVMELVKDAHGNPAPRLGDLSFGSSEAYEIHGALIQEVVRMLCAGVIHGDLSDFNVLMGVDGPVLIDFPQSVDPVHNRNARDLLLRDVDNLHRFLERFSPEQPRRAHAEEMWSLYESNRLAADTRMRGDYRPPEAKADTDEVLSLIDDANLEEQRRRGTGGGEEEAEEAPRAPSPMREVVTFTSEAKPRPGARKGGSGGRGSRPERPPSGPAGKRVMAKASTSEGGAAPKKRRSRRRRKASAKANTRASTEASPEARSETKASVSQSETTATEKAPVAPSAATRPRRRRRRGRSGNRDRSEQAKAGARSSSGDSVRNE